MSFEREKYHRRSIRLQGYDYTQAGAYFVTVCILDRECLLGEVIDGAMRPGPLGRAVEESWTWLAQQYAYIDLDEWVVMPNHLHAILVIGDDGDDRSVGAVREPPPRVVHERPLPKDRDRPPTKRKPLGRLIGAFKTVSTRRVNELRDTPGATLWQRNYYEHIVRGEAELDRIRQYIADNPAQGPSDPDNPELNLDRTARPPMSAARPTIGAVREPPLHDALGAGHGT